MFFQTIEWYDLGDFVSKKGMLEADTALLENQRVQCAKLRGIDRTSSTRESTEECLGLVAV